MFDVADGVGRITFNLPQFGNALTVAGIQEFLHALNAKKKIDERLFGKKGDAGRSRMIERLRESEGTPGFSRLYREYVRGHGMPGDIPTLMLLLDVEEEQEALKVIEALQAAAESAPSEQRSLLKSRLKNVEMSTSLDALADAATDLIARL